MQNSLLRQLEALILLSCQIIIGKRECYQKKLKDEFNEKRIGEKTKCLFYVSRKKSLTTTIFFQIELNEKYLNRIVI